MQSSSLLRPLTALLIVVGVSACSSERSGSGGKPAPDLTAEPWYPSTTRQAAEMNRNAEKLYRANKADEAAAIIEQTRPLVERLLTARQPTLAAMEAASDLDDLHGRMLLANRHFGWARLLFQKNVARWKRWEPQTEDTLRRLKQAEAAIAECDRGIE